MSISISNEPAGTNGASTASGAAAAATPITDKDAFMKLLVAQLSHQDPLEPMEGTEFVTQLAQFTSVEQALAQSQQLEILSAQMTGLSNNAAADLVGQTVTVRGSAVAFDGVSSTGSNVTLGGPAETVTATVKDSAGAVVKTIELGAKPEGPLHVSWDGTDENGNTVPAGSYTIEVDAQNAAGDPVDVTQEVTGVVVGVDYSKGYAELILDSGAKAPVGDLVSVGQSSSNSSTSLLASAGGTRLIP